MINPSHADKFTFFFFLPNNFLIEAISKTFGK